MQEFDYSNETSNDLYDAVDGLSYEEAVFAKEAIEKIKEEKEEKHNIQKYTGTLPEHNTRISYATVTGGASCGK